MLTDILLVTTVDSSLQIKIVHAQTIKRDGKTVVKNYCVQKHPQGAKAKCLSRMAD